MFMFNNHLDTLFNAERYSRYFLHFYFRLKKTIVGNERSNQTVLYTEYEVSIADFLLENYTLLRRQRSIK